MRELTAIGLQAVSGGLQMRPPPALNVRRFILAILERIIQRLGGGPNPHTA
jgi:hypothetical protein